MGRAGTLGRVPADIQVKMLGRAVCIWKDQGWRHVLQAGVVRAQLVYTAQRLDETCGSGCGQGRVPSLKMPQCGEGRRQGRTREP